jgi:hypothetical protein
VGRYLGKAALNGANSNIPARACRSVRVRNNTLFFPGCRPGQASSRPARRESKQVAGFDRQPHCGAGIGRLEITAGEFTYSPQPIAHGVSVDVEFGGRSLYLAITTEEGFQRVEQRPIRALALEGPK